MKTRLSFLLSFALSQTIAGSVPVSATVDPEPADGPGEAIYVDAADILYLESFPVQVKLQISGSLPTPCHEPAWKVEVLEYAIDVRLWSEAEPGRVCITVLEPFEVTIGLGSYESASLPVTLNGTEVGRVEIPGPPQTPHTRLSAAGRSFGMCLGYCRADLGVDGADLLFTGGENMSEAPLFTNAGTLTAEGQERLDAVLADIDVGELEPVYGCPDCADGGAAYLAFSQDGQVSRHDMEFDRPPTELAEVYELAMTLLMVLETCRPDELVTAAEGCTPADR